MVAGKARKGTTIEDILYEMKKENQLLHALLRDRKGFSTSETKPIGTSGGTSGAAGPSGFLKTAGDTMIGPIAFFPDLAIIDASDNSINVSKDAQLAFTSRAIVSAISSTTLETIHGASFAGQILMIQGILTETFTIVQTGNIRTFDGGDIEIVDNQNIWLVFDSIANEWAAVGGSGGSGTGTHISADLIANQTTSLAVGNHIEYDRNATPTGIDGGIVLQTGVGQANGIFELLAGKTYFLSAAAAPIKAAATILEMAWYDRTAGNEIGRRAIMDVAGAVNLETLPKAEIIFTPTVDTLVDFRIVANVTPANLTGFFAGYTYAHIFEFSGKNGADGTPGLDGSPAWKTPVRACAIGNVANLAAFTVLQDGVTLIEGDRVLLTQQTTASENGIYDVGVVAAGLAPLTRSLDLNTSAELIASIFVAVEEGTTKANTLWQLTSNNPMTIGVTAQVWTEFKSVTAFPDYGQGNDGLDAIGEFVFDGRQALARQYLKIWEQIEIDPSDNIAPSSGMVDLIYIPSVANATPGRIIICGENNVAPAAPAIYSDDYGSTFVKAAGLSNGNSYSEMAYSPTLDIVVMVGGSSTYLQAMKKSTDRGANWVNAGNPSPQNSFTDIIWSAADAQFVAVANISGGLNSIYTSTDGATWTIRTTPVPLSVPAAAWTKITYNATLGLYLAATGGVDVMTSSDAITWTAAIADTSLGSLITIISSDGQSKFIALRNTTVLTSLDGIIWDGPFTPPNVGTMNDIVWAADLSTYVILGSSPTGLAVGPQIFWISPDAENWEQMPKNTMAIGAAGTSSFKRSIDYAEEFGYFFACNSGFGTTQELLWRTSLKLG